MEYNKNDDVDPTLLSHPLFFYFFFWNWSFFFKYDFEKES